MCCVLLERLAGQLLQLYKTVKMLILFRNGWKLKTTLKIYVSRRFTRSEILLLMFISHSTVIVIRNRNVSQTCGTFF